MTPRLIAAAVVAVGLLAAPAQAARVERLKGCYVSAGQGSEEREDVRVSGRDFTPVSRVEVLLDGLLVGTPPTGSIGEFWMLVDVPYQGHGERRFAITVRDAANPAISVTVSSRVTNLAVTMRPRRTAPSRRVRLRGRGFMLDRPVFGHYLYGGEPKRTVRLARRTKGRCGRFSVRRRQIPVANPRTGRWILQVDQHRAYSPEPDPVWVRVPIDVTRTFLLP